MSISTISNERMESFLDTIARQAREALTERTEDILRAWHENIEEAQANDDKFPPLKIAIGATVDLEGNKIETAVVFTTRYKSTISEALPDPNQLEIPMVVDAAKKGGKP